MVEMKSDKWTPLETLRHLMRSMKIKRQALREVSSSNMTWENLSAP